MKPQILLFKQGSHIFVLLPSNPKIIQPAPILEAKSNSFFFNAWRLSYETPD